jgi:hypothetical protein
VAVDTRGARIFTVKLRNVAISMTAELVLLVRLMICSVYIVDHVEVDKAAFKLATYKLYAVFVEV